MTITIGTWIVPTLITIIAFVIAGIKIDKYPNTGLFGNSLEALFFNAIALIFSLVVWLIYAFFFRG